MVPSPKVVAVELTTPFASLASTILPYSRAAIEPAFYFRNWPFSEGRPGLGKGGYLRYSGP
jgi:hypothetical protein